MEQSAHDYCISFYLADSHFFSFDGDQRRYIDTIAITNVDTISLILISEFMISCQGISNNSPWGCLGLLVSVLTLIHLKYVIYCLVLLASLLA